MVVEVLDTQELIKINSDDELSDELHDKPDDEPEEQLNEGSQRKILYKTQEWRNQLQSRVSRTQSPPCLGMTRVDVWTQARSPKMLIIQTMIRFRILRMTQHLFSWVNLFLKPHVFSIARLVVTFCVSYSFVYTQTTLPSYVDQFYLLSRYLADLLQWGYSVCQLDFYCRS